METRGAVDMKKKRNRDLTKIELNALLFVTTAGDIYGDGVFLQGKKAVSVSGYI